MPNGQAPILPTGQIEPLTAANAPSAGFDPVSLQPRDETEKQERKGTWKQFLTNLSTDPSMQRSLLVFGTELLKPIPVGGTPGGQIGGAIQKGVAAGEALEAGQAKGALAERRVGAAETTAEAAMIRAKAARAGKGGGISGRVQEVNQIANALKASNPDNYPDTKAGHAKAVLAARDISRQKSREERILAYSQATILPGDDPIENVRRATAAVDAVGGTEAPGGEIAEPVPKDLADAEDGKLYRSDSGKLGRWDEASQTFIPVTGR